MQLLLGARAFRVTAAVLKVAQDTIQAGAHLLPMVTIEETAHISVQVAASHDAIADALSEAITACNTTANILSKGVEEVEDEDEDNLD
jgi:hypothetical protein